jgi:hypothetical protein
MRKGIGRGKRTEKVTGKRKGRGKEYKNLKGRGKEKGESISR